MFIQIHTHTHTDKTQSYLNAKLKKYVLAGLTVSSGNNYFYFVCHLYFNTQMDDNLWIIYNYIKNIVLSALSLYTILIT